MWYRTPRHKLMVSPCMMSRELIRNNKHRKSWIRLTCFCSRETMTPQKLNGLIMDSWTERLISCWCIQLNKKGGFMVCCCIKEAGLTTLEGAVSVGQQSSGYKYLVAGRRKKSMVDILCTHHTHPPSDPWRRPYHFSEIHHKKRSGEGFAVLSWVWAYPTFLVPAMPMSVMQTHSGSHNQSFLYSLRQTQAHK